MYCHKPDKWLFQTFIFSVTNWLNVIDIVPIAAFMNIFCKCVTVCVCVYVSNNICVWTDHEVFTPNFTDFLCGICMNLFNVIGFSICFFIRYIIEFKHFYCVFLYPKNDWISITFHVNYAPNLIEFKHSCYLVLWTCVILLGIKMRFFIW